MEQVLAHRGPSAGVVLQTYCALVRSMPPAPRAARFHAQLDDVLLRGGYAATPPGARLYANLFAVDIHNAHLDAYSGVCRIAH